jgi:proteic killer suppression protein
VELAFETVGLRRVCESDVEARKCFPEGTAGELQDRLADMRAATSVSDLVAGRPYLDAQPPGRIQFGLDGRYELVCVGNHLKPPLTDDGLVDFGRMRRVKVVMIAQEPQNG